MSKKPITEYRWYQFYVENDIGIEVSPTRKPYYPMKPRSCKNCALSQITQGGVTVGCCGGFPIENIDGTQRPTTKCFPIKDDSWVAEEWAERMMSKLDELNHKEDSL